MKLCQYRYVFKYDTKESIFGVVCTNAGSPLHTEGHEEADAVHNTASNSLATDKAKKNSDFIAIARQDRSVEIFVIFFICILITFIVSLSIACRWLVRTAARSLAACCSLLFSSSLLPHLYNMSVRKNK